MTKRTKKLPFKIFSYGIFLFLVYVMQTSVFSRLTISGVKPIIMPLVVVSAAIFEGSVKGGLIGIAAGMLCDISFNQPPVQFTLILTLIGIVVGLFSDTLFARGFPTYFIGGTLSILICTFAQIFGPIIFYGLEFSALSRTVIFQCIYSLLFLLPVYIAVRRISRIPGSY